MEESDQQEIISESSNILNKVIEYTKTSDYKIIENIMNNNKGKELGEQEKSQLKEIFSKEEFADSNFLWTLLFNIITKHEPSTWKIN